MSRKKKDARPPAPTDGVPQQAKLEQLAADRERPAHTELTTDQGIPIPHTDDSLKAGPRGPTLLEDFHLREKITRFDHERIPERVVHARGSGAHGFFQVYESLSDLTCADFLCDPTARTPVFVRFSTVVGSRGSSDLARDVRGFATKFYTREGNFDLVGNNMPVFFIQDGAKFPDLVHAVKPEPHHEMPQAASAHDTFWDFVSLVPETMHMVMWVMSDRALPRSYRMMEGFGVHTFRLVDRGGRSVLCKFHWKPVLGAHSLLWDEAQKISGKDPDFHRRDLWEAIETGNHPEYELGLQIVQEKDEQAYGFDLLDPTKLLPEELVPVRRVGRLTLNRNPDNFFAETEQVAFCVANVVPGIDFTNDPLMQARLFSYLDTQITRLGGPNFAELPINRPVAPVHNHQQDGFGRKQIPTARALYHPNSIQGNEPRLAPDGFVHRPERVAGPKTRERSASFGDHFSQARMFLDSQSPPERAHLLAACQFELAKVERLGIRERVVRCFAQIDPAFAEQVAAAIAVSRTHTAPPPPPDVQSPKSAPRQRLPASPALSLANSPKQSMRSRKVAVLAAPGVRADDLDQLRQAICGAGGQVEVVSHVLGPLRSAEGRPVDVDKTWQTASSVFYDAVCAVGGSDVEELAEGPAREFVQEAFDHFKPIGATNEGVRLLAAIQLAGVELAKASGKRALSSSLGVVTALGTDLEPFGAALVAAIAQHRHFDRTASPFSSRTTTPPSKSHRAPRS
jgi:catalase